MQLGARKLIITSIQEHEKNCFPASWKWKKLVPSYFEPDKTIYLKSGSQPVAISLQLFGERKKWIPAIWRPKNVVHNCQEQGKRL